METLHTEHHSDTLFKTLLVTSLLHVVILAGVSFSQAVTQSTQTSLDVTLVQHKSDKAPKKADFIAQANQEGSGTLDKKALISTTEMADFYDNTIREIQPIPESAPELQQETIDELISTFAPSPRETALKKTQEQEKKSEISHEKITNETFLEKQNFEIASLEAQLREMKQAFAKKPRRKQLTAMSTQENKYAIYLDAWRIRVETVGNLHYPELDISGLFGHVRLMVAVKNDGTLHEVRILKSSGQAALDQAAIRVVRLASPFDPFPEDVRKENDILDIIRTWQFEKGRYQTID